MRHFDFASFFVSKSLLSNLTFVDCILFMPQVDFASKLSKPVGIFSQRIVSDLPPPTEWRIQKFKRHCFDFSIIFKTRFLLPFVDD